MITIIDARGACLHSYFSGTARDTVTTESGKKVPAASHMVDAFYKRYLEPILEDGTAPREIIFVWDKGGAMRKALYPEYKASREKPEDDSPEQGEAIAAGIEAIKGFTAYIGCTHVLYPGVEADDVIALMVSRLKGDKRVYTVDQDLLQLPTFSRGDDTVQVYLKGEPVDYDNRPVPADLIALHKALVGDSSDNYPGVRGLGPKAWERMCATFLYDGMQELDRILNLQDRATFEHVVAETSDKNLARILEHWNDAVLFYRLAKLHPEWCEGPLEGKFIRPMWLKRVPNRARCEQELAGAGMSPLVERFDHLFPRQWYLDSPLTEEEFAEAESLFADSPIVAFDYETYDPIRHEPYREASRSNAGDFVDVLSAKICGASFCFGRNHEFVFYVPVAHRDSPRIPQEDIRALLEAAERKSVVAVQNAMFEAVVSQQNLGWCPGTLHDTAIMASYVDENRLSGLKQSALHYLGYKMASYSETVGEAEDMRDLTVEQVLQYGCDDALATAHLYDLYRLILELEGTWDFVHTHEFDVVHPLKDGFIAGTAIDYARLSALEAEDDREYDRLESRVYELLDANVTETNVAGVDDLFQERAQLMRVQLAGEENLEARLQALKERTLEGCTYRAKGPPTHLLEDPTGKDAVNAVAAALGLPKISSWSVKGLLAWTEQVDPKDKQGRRLFELIRYQGFRTAKMLKEATDGSKLKPGPFRDRLVEFITHELTTNDSLQVTTRFNFGSPVQLQNLFYGILGLPVLHRNLPDMSTGVGRLRKQHDLPGEPATNDAAMQMLLAELDEDDWRREVVEAIHEIKAIDTRRSLYYKPYPLWKSPHDGRIHPQIRNCGTVTRRPSGSAPNILQVSKTKDEGKLRSVFVADEGEVIVSIDFQQQELRITADLSRDPNLMACYVGAERRDVHTTTAAGQLKMDYDEVRAAYKDPTHPRHPEVLRSRGRIAKITNFLLIYGGTPTNLAVKACIPKTQAEEFFDRTFATYPGLEPWQESVRNFARQHGYVLTAYGNRRHFGDAVLGDDAAARRAGRQAVNAPVQSTAADILKVVLSTAHRRGVFRDNRARLIAPVYDEVVASVPVGNVAAYVQQMLDVMEITPPGFEVPMVGDVSLGRSWGEQIELGERPSAADIQKALDRALSHNRSAAEEAA